MKKTLLCLFLLTGCFSFSFAQDGKQAKPSAKPSKVAKASQKTDAQLYAEQMKAEAKPAKSKTTKN
jgi:hypothetical protein